MEQRDPTMGPNARLDIVEYPSDAGSAASYDVSVVTSVTMDDALVEACAAEPGLAAQRRHDYKLDQQYQRRTPGATLIPLVAEVGGRWHPSVPDLVRKMAKERANRYAIHPEDASAALVSRWAARLSALLIRGNAAVVLATRAPLTPFRQWQTSSSSTVLPHLLPEGDSAYELLCGVDLEA